MSDEEERKQALVSSHPHALSRAGAASLVRRGVQDLISNAEAEAARGSLTKRRLDPENLKDLIIIGGYHLEAGVREFGKWSESVIDDTDEVVKPYLDAVYQALMRYFGEKALREPEAEATDEDLREGGSHARLMTTSDEDFDRREAAADRRTRAIIESVRREGQKHSSNSPTPPTENSPDDIEAVFDRLVKLAIDNLNRQRAENKDAFQK